LYPFSTDAESAEQAGASCLRRFRSLWFQPGEEFGWCFDRMS
jgi:hypothetical protein